VDILLGHILISSSATDDEVPELINSLVGHMKTLKPKVAAICVQDSTGDAVCEQSAGGWLSSLGYGMASKVVSFDTVGVSMGQGSSALIMFLGCNASSIAPFECILAKSAP
jgi:hypothetical protein